MWEDYKYSIFSKKNEKIKNLKNGEKKWPWTPIYTYYWCDYWILFPVCQRVENLWCTVWWHDCDVSEPQKFVLMPWTQSKVMKTLVIDMFSWDYSTS